MSAPLTTKFKYSLTTQAVFVALKKYTNDGTKGTPPHNVVLRALYHVGNVCSMNLSTMILLSQDAALRF